MSGGWDQPVERRAEQADLFNAPAKFTRTGSSIVPPQPAEVARARSLDPPTSHASAALVSKFAAGHFARILVALKRLGPMTIAELAAATNLDHIQVARRLPEMQRDARRLVEVARDEHGNEITRNGPSGRAQRVWRAL